MKHAPVKSGVMAAAGASDVPGTFPDTPAVEENAFSVNPLPATEGAGNPIKLAPGEEVPHPSTFTSETVTSGVRDDPELVAAHQAKVAESATAAEPETAAEPAKDESESAFGVAPLPAFAGAVNPVTVAPGEALPHPTTITDNTIHSAVTTDKESYENSGGLGNAPVLPPVVTQGEQDLKGTRILDLPPLSNTLIPESSLPIGATEEDAVPTIQSAGPQTTTAQLAGAVPLESSKVPEIVKESQEKAGFSPEASAVPEEVAEKGDVEKELLSEVPEAPSTSEGTGGKETADKSEKGVSAGEVAAAVGGAAVAIGGAAVALASGATEKLPESVTSKLPEVTSKIPESVTSKLPESVQHSINDINAKSNNGTAADANLAETTAEDTPEVVKKSIAESGETPEAAANEEAVLEKKAVEKELLSEVKPETSTGEPAPTAASTTPSALAAPAAPAAASDVAGSRDISPGTVPGDHTAAQTAPTVTTGVVGATTEATTEAPSTPAKSTTTTGTGSPAGSAAAAAEKKKKRTSIFGKLKAKFSDKK